ncbi:MAG: VOC family protein [Crocinitomicaceae bacterium]
MGRAVNTMSLPPFHIAIPVHDLEIARAFYLRLFDCSVGRASEEWVDLNFYGHQFVLHLKREMKPDHHHNLVDGKSVPVPHYGVVLPWEKWHELSEKLQNSGVDFVIEPYIRFKGEVGEQATLFLLDPSGNALEFKAFRNSNQLFAH